MDLPLLPSTAGVDDVAAAIDEVGAVIVADLLPAASIADLRAELAPWFDATVPGSRSDDEEWRLFHGEHTKRFSGLAAKSPAAVSLITHPLLVGWSERALLPSCGSIQLAGSQAMVVGPGQQAQYLHRDQSAWAWFNQLLPGGPEVVTVCMVAVTDFTEDNGATRVVPGSHRLADDERLYDPAAGVAAEMSAGSVLLFSGNTIHGAGANRTVDQWRFGINLSYALGWLRPEEAHPFVIEPEVARSLPPRARQLLGFTQYDPPVGDGGRLWLVDFEDPAPLFGGR
jgi:ectoine hydroxylase-related dioxygenase (phytanoyl-CoA dioxygenase family)